MAGRPGKCSGNVTGSHGIRNWHHTNTFHLLNQLVALLQFKGSVLEGGGGSVLDLQPVLIGRLADVCHRKAQGTQAWKRKTPGRKQQRAISRLPTLTHSVCFVFWFGRLTWWLNINPLHIKWHNYSADVRTGILIITSYEVIFNISFIKWSWDDKNVVSRNYFRQTYDA